MANRLKRNLEIGDEEQTLKAPAHWHVDVLVYEYLKNGEFVNPVHVHNLVTNDKTLAVSYAISEAQEKNQPPRREYQLEQIVWCDDQNHLDRTPSLLKGKNGKNKTN